VVQGGGGSCDDGISSVVSAINLYANPNLSAGLIAGPPSGGCGLTNCPTAGIYSISASGSTITLKDNGGHTGTITLTGGTATGSFTASIPSGGCGLTNCPPPLLYSITATGGTAIAVKDGAGHTGTITLSGLVAQGGLTASNGNCIMSCPTIAIGEIKSDGAHAWFLTDTDNDIGYLGILP